jgi:hypothetical protein
MFTRALALGLASGLALATASFAEDLTRPPPKEAFAGQKSATSITTPGCNDSSFAQVPGHNDLFLTRFHKGCKPGGDWTVVLDHFDWTANAFTTVKTVIATPQQIEGATLNSAYDPYPANYGGEIWVAFECSGANIAGASTCLAPMNPQNFTTDPSRTYVAISGNRNAPGNQYSASDPKLFSYEGRIFLYWTTVVMNNGKWVGIATRGAELVQEPGGQRRLWAKGSGGRAIEAFDPRLSVEVWAHADMFSIIQAGPKIYATAGNAEGACVSPSKDLPGCFQLTIAESDVPIGQDIFNRDQANGNKLPTVGQEYARFAEAPSGQLVIIGHFVPHAHPWFQQRPMSASAGVAAFPVDVGALFR